MNTTIPCLYLLAALASFAQVTNSEKAVIDYFDNGQPTILRLWPDDSPRNRSRNGKPEATGESGGGLFLTNTERPSLLVYSPPAHVSPTGAALIFCPGGAYGKLSMGNPKGFTEWMTQLGVTVATLKYHVPRAKTDRTHKAPLADAQRAMRVLRANAKQLQLSPDKIGIVGSSAGGHLAFNLCVNHAEPAYAPIDDSDILSARPAVAMLFYPAYLSKKKAALGINPSLHTQEMDGKGMPPIFVTVNGDDGFVHGSLQALIEMKAHKIPAELHLWSKGGHGGVANKYPLVEFARPGARFLVRHQILPEEKIARSDTWLDKTVAELHTPPVAQRGGTATSPPGLPDSELSIIDREIQSRYGATRPVYRIWPGTGKRADDPLKEKDETVTQRNVPVASGVTVPTMTFFPAERADGRGVIVCPGGGYGVLAFEHEGLDLVRWLNSQGISAFLLKYRTPRRANLAKHHVALQDIQRAMRLIRSQAQAFGLRPDAIGVLGFSAGGHLAALASSTLDAPSYAPIDSHDAVSPVADFGILIYPAYASSDGDVVDPLLVPKAKASSPLFIATALDDKWTQGQFFFVHERLKTKQPIEYHIYENGGHGKGMLSSGRAFAQWPRECARWLRDQQ
jgi:acetyl esterase/lipase